MVGDGRAEAALNVVPLAGARGQMTHDDGPLQRVCPRLEAHLPHPTAGAVAADGFHRQARHLRQPRDPTTS
jgi:hypothetical protein